MGGDPVKVATVMSGSGWEPHFVQRARATGVVHVLARCSTAGEVASALPRVDAVLIGADVAWIHAVDFWHSTGVSVIGIAANEPERTLLERAGCDAVFGTDLSPAVLLGVTTSPATAAGTIVSIGGPRGAPGRTEVALGLAWAASRSGSVLLVETDMEAPSMGLRLGLPPPHGLRPLEAGPIEVVTLPARPGPLSASVLQSFLVAAVSQYALVVLDAGPRFDMGKPVMVVSPTPVGLVRAARLLADWHTDPPLLVANRVDGPNEIRKVRAATGLEPDAVVPECRPGHTAPSPDSVAALAPLADRLVAPGQRRAAL